MKADIQPKLVLIGAGPGAADLLTLRAINKLKSAVVILYDALVDADVLDYAPKSAVKIFVGKRGGKPSFSQEKINQLIVSYALTYGEVIRLKGGDPFIFGRGMEEILFARKHGIDAEVVPGISSSTGLTALSQVPLTHRGSSNGFWVLTATKMENQFNRDLLLAAKSDSTLVILMGAEKLQKIVNTFLSVQKGNTPVLIIQNGSLKNQKIVLADISSIVHRAYEEKVKSPAIIVIGEVVSAYRELQNQHAEFSYLN